MNYITLMIKRNTMLFLTSLSVFFCFISVIQISKALSIANDPLILAIDSNGTRVVRRKDDPIFETEAISFIKFYLENLYNFTPENFLKNVGIATSYMSLELWEKEKGKILSHHKYIQENQMSLRAEIRRIYKDDPMVYTSILILEETSRMATGRRGLKLKIYIRRVPRTPLNPYGIEVERYEDEEIK